MKNYNELELESEKQWATLESHTEHIIDMNQIESGAPIENKQCTFV